MVELPVRDHDHVEKAQLLLVIDPRSYEIAVKRAEANLTLEKLQRAAAEADVSAARAQVTEREARYDDAKRNDARIQELLKLKSASQAQADTVRYKLREATAALDAARSKLQQVVREQDEAGARIRVAEAALAQVRLDYSHTRIRAPASGTLGKLEVRPGDVVEKGQQLFPLVEDTAIWVDANYKETDLLRIKAGQPATVVVDMYPDRKFHGVVESISPASGVAFSLLPPENASGNWVKVTQRFPVRVRITDPDPVTPLRVGASSSVTIDTSDVAVAGSGDVQNRQQGYSGGADAS